MNVKYCVFCSARGDFSVCACKYREVLGCGGKVTNRDLTARSDDNFRFADNSSRIGEFTAPIKRTQFESLENLSE